MNDLHTLSSGFETLLNTIHRESRRVLEIVEASGSQGASGSQVRYFQVKSTDTSGGTHHDSLVTKAASLLERRILAQLSGQGCAVPPVHISDLTSEGRALVYMPFTDARPDGDLASLNNPLTASVADGLAGIHAANRANPPPWLPHASENFLDRLWLRAWREQWETNLNDSEFAAEFAPYTRRLDDAMSQFMQTLATITAEGDTLTLLNVDLIPDHIRVWRGKACFIDWEQSAYGTLYLDLPNYFSVETALTYRDALARHGYALPVMEFLERYRELGRYMGLRYLGYSLWVWAQGGDQRRDGRWFLYYTLTLALRGR